MEDPLTDIGIIYSSIEQMVDLLNIGGSPLPFLCE